jgi:hypothetical protein
MYKLQKSGIIKNNLSSCSSQGLNDILQLVIVSLMLVWLYRQIFCKDKLNEKFTQQEKDKLGLRTLHEMLTANCKPEYCNMYSWGKKPDIPENMSLSNFSTSKGCCLVPNYFKTFLYERRCGNTNKM